MTKVNCSIENIKLKIINNAPVDIPFEIMRRLNPDADRSNLVQWNIAGETFDSGYVMLDTTVSLEGTATSLDIEGVVDVLNSFGVATFFYVGTIIYAIDLLEASVATADLTIGDSSFSIGTGFDNFANDVKLQSDGKLVVGGFFLNYDGTAASSIIRLNSDGSVDTSFVYGTGIDNLVETLAIQSDGKILIGGAFNDYNGDSVGGLVRVNSNGTIDSGFLIGSGVGGATILIIAIQSDGKILLGGQFISFNGTGANRIIRLNSDGSVDGTFIYGTGFDGGVEIITIQSDGKILIGGQFSTYNGTGANRIIRLNSDGSVDGTFVYGTGFGNTVQMITEDLTGKILVGGGFSTYNGTGANRIIRLNSDGSIDGTFVYGTGFVGYIEDIRVLSSGKILIVGSFTSYQGISSNDVVLLNNDGSIDTAFVYGTGFNSGAYAIEILANGKYLLVGAFTSYQGTTYNRIIRLNTDGSSGTTT